MDKNSKIIVAVAVAGQAVMAGVIFLQHRSMKKSNAEAERIVDEASMFIQILENACDSSIDALNNDELDFEEKLGRIAEQFAFIEVVVDEKRSGRREG